MEKYIIKDYKFNGNNSHKETLFSLGNGFLGIRGSFLEKTSNTEGAFINTFYDTKKISYGESAYGFPKINESMVKLPDFRKITFSIDGVLCNLSKENIKNYKRELNMKKGILKTEYIYIINDKKVRVISESLLSFVHEEISLVKYELEPLNFNGEIKVISSLSHKVENEEIEDDPRVKENLGEEFSIIDNILYHDLYGYTFQTKNSAKKLTITESMEVNKGEFLTSEIYEKNGYNNILTFNAKKNQIISLVKKNIIYFGKFKRENIFGEKFNWYLDRQIKYLKKFWDKNGLKINSSKSLSQGMNFNLFHLFQSVNKKGDFGIAAKGLTGIGYDGHNFWDTEIFIFPFFLFTMPELARKLLIYRYNGLQKAKKRAKELGCSKGAKFPWRTISGAECSGYFLAGTAQYHINADIAYAVILYYQVTDDLNFMEEYGMEMLSEIAKFFLEIGYFDNENNFKIDGVTGPDEYTVLVNNNYYTNRMVANNFKNLVKYSRKFKNKYLTNKEVLLIEKAYKNMYFSYNKEKCIYSQDESFLTKKKLDINSIPKEKFPLLLNYHPLYIYRHQICKQADICLADVLLDNEIDYKTKKAHYDYYLKVTTHDSSLSYNTYGIMACDLGLMEDGFKFYSKNIRLDLENLHHNSEHGIHTAAMGGSWMGLVYGFAGLRIRDSKLYFDPKTYKEIDNYEFIIKYKKARLKIMVNEEKIRYKLIEGENINFYHKSQLIILNSKKTSVML